MVARIKITLQEAIDGFTMDMEMRRLSPHTIADYHNTFRYLVTYLDPETPFHKIKPSHIKDFFRWRSGCDEAPDGCAPRPAKAISKKTLLNYHTGLSALWTWATAPEQNFAKDHIMRSVPRPKPEKRVIQPLTKSDIQALLDVCDYAKPYQHHRRHDRKPTRAKRSTGVRDRAIILLLLDTGLRASELCNLRLQDIDLKNSRLIGIGKGDKERSIPFTTQTAKALWRYKLQREKLNGGELPSHETLFRSTRGHPLNRNALLRALQSLGETAGIADVHTHRFRHTFAIMYLRNSGDLFTLQMLLGHESLEMVRRYARIASADAERVHKTASPVANLNLR